MAHQHVAKTPAVQGEPEWPTREMRFLAREADYSANDPRTPGPSERDWWANSPLAPEVLTDRAMLGWVIALDPRVGERGRVPLSHSRRSALVRLVVLLIATRLAGMEDRPPSEKEEAKGIRRCLRRLSGAAWLEPEVVELAKAIVDDGLKPLPGRDVGRLKLNLLKPYHGSAIDRLLGGAELEGRPVCGAAVGTRYKGDLEIELAALMRKDMAGRQMTEEEAHESLLQARRVEFDRDAATRWCRYTVVPDSDVPPSSTLNPDERALLYVGLTMHEPPKGVFEWTVWKGRLTRLRSWSSFHVEVRKLLDRAGRFPDEIASCDFARMFWSAVDAGCPAEREAAPTSDAASRDGAAGTNSSGSTDAEPEFDFQLGEGYGSVRYRGRDLTYSRGGIRRFTVRNRAVAFLLAKLTGRKCPTPLPRDDWRALCSALRGVPFDLPVYPGDFKVPAQLPSIDPELLVKLEVELSKQRR